MYELSTRSPLTVRGGNMVPTLVSAVKITLAQ